MTITRLKYFGRLKAYNNMPVRIVQEIDDDEGGYLVEFTDGSQHEAWPEEIVTIRSIRK